MYFSVVCTVCTYAQIMILFDFFHVLYYDFFSYCMKINFDSFVSLILLLCCSSFANILLHLVNSFITFFLVNYGLPLTAYRRVDSGLDDNMFSQSTGRTEGNYNSNKEIKIREEDKNESGNGINLDLGPTGGDEFAAVKPWLGAIVPPTAWMDGPKGTGSGVNKNVTQSEKIVRTAAYFTALSQLNTIHNKIRGSQSNSSKGPSSGISSLSITGGKNVYDEVRASCKQVAAALSISGVNNSTAPDGDELELEWIHGTYVQIIFLLLFLFMFSYCFFILLLYYG